MPIENRDLPAGTRLVATYKKQAYVCTVESEEEGKLAFVVDGKRFTSPSSAGSAVMGGAACNGWRFWTVEGGEQPASEAPVPKPAKEKKGALKLFKRLTSHGLEEGQQRWFCAACQDSFIATDAYPEVCEAGHRTDGPELAAGGR